MHVSSSPSPGGRSRRRRRRCRAGTLELGDDLHRAHLRRARDGAGRKARAQQLERRDALAQLADHLRDEMRHVRVALRLHEALDAHRARHADAREVVAAEVDEHRVLRSVLLRREQRLRVALSGRDRPRDRVQLGAASFALDDGLRRAADEREIPELEQEEIRRRVDAPQRAVELDGRGRRRAGRALRDHDLEDVALADVLLRTLDAAEVLVARRLALERTARRRAAGQGRRRAGEPGRLAAQELGDTARVVEAQQDVRDEKEALRHAGPVVGQRHRRLECRDGVVAEIADDRLAASSSASANETTREPEPTKL